MDYGESNKNKHLEKWTGKQWARSADNSLQAAIWVYRWGWTTAQILNRLLAVKRPGLGMDLVKKGVLDRIEARPGWRESFVFILTEYGVALAEQALDQYTETFLQVKTLSYSLNESRRIPWSLHSHNIVSQHILLDILGPRPAPELYSTESEYRSDIEVDDAVPDFGYVDEELNWVDCELELNHKSDLRLKRWLWLRVKEMRKQPNLKLRIFTCLNSVEVAIEAILQKREIFEVSKSTGGKLLERGDKAGVELAPFLERISIERLVKMHERRTGGLGLED